MWMDGRIEGGETLLSERSFGNFVNVQKTDIPVLNTEHAARSMQHAVCSNFLRRVHKIA